MSLSDSVGLVLWAIILLRKVTLSNCTPKLYELEGQLHYCFWNQDFYLALAGSDKISYGKGVDYQLKGPCAIFINYMLKDTLSYIYIRYNYVFVL